MDPIEVLSATKSELNLPLSKTTSFDKLRSALQNVRSTFHETGFKGVIRRYGWKVFAVFFVYYFVRDLTLYIAIPWLIARHFTF